MKWPPWTNTQLLYLILSYIYLSYFPVTCLLFLLQHHIELIIMAYLFSIASLSNHQNLSELNNMSVLSHRSIGQILKWISWWRRVKPKRWLGCALFWRLWGGASVSLTFPVSRSYLLPCLLEFFPVFPSPRQGLCPHSRCHPCNSLKPESFFSWFSTPFIVRLSLPGKSRIVSPYQGS